MTLHPQAQAVLDFRKAHGGPASTAPLQQLRAADLDAPLIYGESATDVDVEFSYIAGPTADLPLLTIRPKIHKSGSGALVYFHGGGWVFNQLIQNLSSKHSVIHIGYTTYPLNTQ